MDKRKGILNNTIGHGAVLEENNKVFKPFSTVSSEYRKSCIADKGGHCTPMEMKSFICVQQTDDE